MTIDNRELNERLQNLYSCAENAPAGTYEREKEIVDAIEEISKSIFAICKESRLKLLGDDRFRNIELAIYNLICESNPDEYAIPIGEGFGFAMNSPARDRVLEQTKRNRDLFLLIHGGGDAR